MSKLAQLAALALDECDRKLWSRTWSGGGCYLHLEVSEFIEALRGKGDPVAEAADVLFVLLSTMSANGVDVDQVVARLEDRLTTPTGGDVTQAKGYSVGGYGELSYVSDESYRQAEKASRKQGKT